MPSGMQGSGSVSNFTELCETFHLLSFRELFISFPANLSNYQRSENLYRSKMSYKKQLERLAGKLIKDSLKLNKWECSTGFSRV